MGRRARKKNKKTKIIAMDTDSILSLSPIVVDCATNIENYITVTWTSVIGKTTGHCSICNFPLDTEYPEDYPDDWKFCCSCFKLARRITGTWEYNSDFVELLDHDIKESPILKKILHKITLVKGNEGKK